MRLRPITVKAAIPFCAQTHRHLPKVQGGMWAVSVRTGDGVVGVAIVGNPARLLMEDNATLCVLRVAVQLGHPNACSMLLGACSRAMKAMGCDNGVTYTLPGENGASLRAANWVDGGLTDGRGWSRESRPRQAPLFPEPKRRWWAPWSLRVREASNA